MFFLDDGNAIEHNESIRGLWPATRFLSAPPESPANGRPVASFSFALSYALGGLDPWGFKLGNLLVHAAAAAALFGLVRRALGLTGIPERLRSASTSLAFSCALIWLVHPLQSECVNYVSQRTESLMGLFAFLTLYAAIRAAGGRCRRAWSALAFLACLLGMGSKEVMVAIPPLVVLFDRAFLYGSLREAFRRRSRLWLALGSTLALVVATMIAAPRSRTVGSGHGVGAWQWALNQCSMIPHYLRLFLWPHPLIADYGMPRRLSLADVWPGAVVVATALLATAIHLWRRPRLGFLGAWFFALLAPTSSVVPILTEVGAERRVYAPSAALVLLAIIGGHRVLGSLVHDPRRRRLAGALLVALVAASLGVVSARRNLDYSSDVSIWQSVVERVADNARAHENLAIALHAAGRSDAAIAHYEEALRLKTSPLIPAHRAIALFNMGVLLEERGELERAVLSYRRALRERPRFARALARLGALLLESGRADQAVARLRAALDLEPDHYRATFDLGRALETLGDLREAIEAYRRAAGLRPSEPGPRKALARLGAR